MAQVEKKSLVFQTIVTVAGLLMWLASVALLFTRHSGREQLILVGFIPLIIVISLFPNTFTLPGSRKREKITFTLSDAFISSRVGMEWCRRFSSPARKVSSHHAEVCGVFPAICSRRG